MAITILSTPGEFQPVFSADGHNLSFVIDSNQSFLCSMNYVMDVYINELFVNRVRTSPNLADGKCVFQLDGILHNFMSFDLWEGPNFQLCQNSFLKYEVQFGEETDGTTNCTGGEFNIVLGPSFSAWAFNGTLQYIEKDFNETDYYVNTATPSLFLTNSPDELSININDEQYLYYINNMIVSTASGASASQAMEVKITLQNGNTQTWYVLNQQIEFLPKSIISIGTSPNNINDYVTQGIVYNSFGIQATQSIIDCNVDFYEVAITNYQITG